MTLPRSLLGDLNPGRSIASSIKGRKALARGLAAWTDPITPNTKVRIVAQEVWLTDALDVPKRFNNVDLLVDLGTTGANGIDTGAIAASTEYDFYIIGKADGTVAGLASKGLQWDESQGYGVGNRDSAILLRDAAARTYLAQGIQVAATAKLHSIHASLARTGTPVGYMWAEIWSDSGGNPSALVAGGVSIPYPVNDIDTAAYQVVRFVFPGRPTLTSGTQYHLVFRANYAIGANVISVGVDTTAPGYASGTFKSGDATPTWTDLGYDMAVLTLNVLTGSELNPSLPAGYTYFARVSWDKTDGSSNLLRFYQNGPEWRVGDGGKDTTGAWTINFWNLVTVAAYAGGAWVEAYHYRIAADNAAHVNMALPVPIGSPVFSTWSPWKNKLSAAEVNFNGPARATTEGWVGPAYWISVSANVTEHTVFLGVTLDL